MNKFFSPVKKNKANWFTEYALLLAVVAAALTIMYSYMQKSVNTCLKNIQSEISDEPTWEDGSSGGGGAGGNSGGRDFKRE